MDIALSLALASISILIWRICYNSLFLLLFAFCLSFLTKNQSEVKIRSVVLFVSEDKAKIICSNGLWVYTVFSLSHHKGTLSTKSAEGSHTYARTHMLSTCSITYLCNQMAHTKNHNLLLWVLEKLYNSCLSKPPAVCVLMEYVCAMHGIPRHFWDTLHKACWQGEGLWNIWCCSKL